MNSSDLNDYGVRLANQGKIDLAIQMWQEAHNADNVFSTPALNLYSTYRKQGNLALSHKWLIAFLNRPVTGFTIGSIPQFQKELQEIEKQMNPQIQQAPVPVQETK